MVRSDNIICSSSFEGLLWKRTRRKVFHYPMDLRGVVWYVASIFFGQVVYAHVMRVCLQEADVDRLDVGE